MSSDGSTETPDIVHQPRLPTVHEDVPSILVDSGHKLCHQTITQTASEDCCGLDARELQVEIHVDPYMQDKEEVHIDIEKYADSRTISIQQKESFPKMKSHSEFFIEPTTASLENQITSADPPTIVPVQVPFSRDSTSTHTDPLSSPLHQVSTTSQVKLSVGRNLLCRVSRGAVSTPGSRVLTVKGRHGHKLKLIIPQDLTTRL